jgi:hypothetical protein
MTNEPAYSTQAGLIEQARKANKLLSLYVLAIQERKPLTADELDGLAQALRSVANIIEQAGQHETGQWPTNARPLAEGSIAPDAKPDDSTVEA